LYPLTLFFIIITRLGSELFYFLFVPLLCWCVDEELGVKVGVFVCISTYVGSLLKALFKLPRPPKPQRKIKVKGYGFPCGHSINAGSLWTYLSLKWRKYSNFSLLLLALIPLIAFSRVYLGVQYPWAVIAGVGIGLLLSATFLSVDLTYTPRWERIIPYFLLLTIPLALVPSDKAALTMGALLGLGSGYMLEKGKKDLNMDSPPLRKSLRLVFGLPPLLLAWFLLNTYTPNLLFFIFMNYFIFGFMTAFLIPELLKRVERLIW